MKVGFLRAHLPSIVRAVPFTGLNAVDADIEHNNDNSEIKNRRNLELTPLWKKITMWRLNPGRVLLPLRGARAASGGGPAELATVSIGGIEAPLHRYRVLVCGTLLLYSSLFQCFRATRRWEIQVVLYVCIVCARVAVEPNGACHYPGLVGERYLAVYQPVFLVRTVSFTRIHTTRS